MDTIHKEKGRASKRDKRPTIKRAAIYVRVSREMQAQKISPQAQEKDCRAYCEEHGYIVIEVYRDTEKYRVGRRLVEPSGTRADRPQLKRMLADAAVGAFDVIIAWREDRLYRGVRPMIDVIDCIEEHGLDIELVKETFDRKMAPIKASIARMELDAKADRVEMGVAGRLSAGKVWPSCIPYGYRRAGDGIELDRAEAKWVRKIWKWYADKLGPREIRQRLVAAGTPQKRKRNSKGAAWEIAIIQRMLRHEYYYTGIQKINWAGQVYDVHLPIIVDPETAQRVAKQREKNKTHPAHHLKHNYLAMGVAYCVACNRKVRAKTQTIRSKGVPRKTPIGEYRCQRYFLGYPEPNCFRTIGAKKLDDQLWEKVWELLSDDEKFQNGIRTQIELASREESDAEGEVARLKQELDSLETERQWVITQARKGAISEADMEKQLAELQIQETETRRELAIHSRRVGNRLEKLIEFANKFRDGAQKSLAWVMTKPKSQKEADRQFAAKRELVETIVKQVKVFPDRTIKVEFEFDFSGMVENTEHLPQSPRSPSPNR